MGENPFAKLGMAKFPVILAPLAGVSDEPFRRICQERGADLSYVEMISATALNYRSQRTWDMLTRHPQEPRLGVQVTARSPEEMAKAVSLLDTRPFDTIDINMGCPVRKVVNSGCGSAILKDPNRVFHTTLAACQNTAKPVSVKIRLGWDHQSLTWKEVALAAQEAGAKWLTIHGRTRSDSYADPVDLEKIAELKQFLKIPVIGNGNIFSLQDAELMQKACHIDGLMVSRGALGNPWIFEEIKGQRQLLNLGEWLRTILSHCDYQAEAYKGQELGAVCMRKHILWYVSGWPHARKIREAVNKLFDFEAIKDLLRKYADELASLGAETRLPFQVSLETANRFVWDPKFDMHRQWDRGVGEDGL